MYVKTLIILIIYIHLTIFVLSEAVYTIRHSPPNPLIYVKKSLLAFPLM